MQAIQKNHLNTVFLFINFSKNSRENIRMENQDNKDEYFESKT